MNKILFVTLLKWVIYGGVIGLIIGSTTAFLISTNDYIGSVREQNSWLIYFLPIGGAAIGYMYMKFGVQAGTELYKGNNLVIEAVHGKTKVLRRLGPIVYLGTFITVIFGGSTGREGAAIQMGGSVAEAINKFFKVDLIDTKLLLMSGISAAFGAAFGTPIAAAVFGMEMTSIGKLKFEAVIPCLVASFTGHFMTEKAWGVEHETFIIQHVPEFSVLAFAKVILLSVIFGLVTVLYTQLRHGIQKVSEKYTKKNHIIRAFIGGVVIVVLTTMVGSNDYNGRGLDMLQESFTTDVPHFAFLAKLVFTAITLGMGFVGGEAIPLFFIGATLGNTLYHVIDMPMSFLAAIGMIAVFSGGANTPLAAFLMAIEMFDGKGAEYFFVACLISYVISGHHGLWPSQTMYEPKSRLYKVKNGEMIKKIEEN